MVVVVNCPPFRGALTSRLPSRQMRNHRAPIAETNPCDFPHRPACGNLVRVATSDVTALRKAIDKGQRSRAPCRGQCGKEPGCTVSPPSQAVNPSPYLGGITGVS
jgi:hypothetical protein